MHALFKAVDQLSKVVGGLRVRGIGRLLRLGEHRRELLLAQLLQLELAGDDVERQLVIILLVLRVELVEHRRVRDELILVAGERGDDLHDVLFHLVILRLELGEGGTGLLEQAEQAALLALVHVEALELRDQIGQHLGDGAGVLGLHIFQNLVGELGDLHLGGVAVLEHGFTVADIDALHEREHSGLLLLGEVVKVQGIVLGGNGLHRLFLDLFLHGGSGSGLRGRFLRRGLLHGRFLHGLFLAGQNQIGHFIIHVSLSFSAAAKGLLMSENVYRILYLNDTPN